MTRRSAGVTFVPFDSRYTQDVAMWAHRLTCLSLTLALSGSPVVLAVCMSLCLESAAPQTVQTGHPAQGDRLQPAAAMPSPHAHHGASAESRPGVPTAHAGQPGAASDPRLNAPCSHCCMDGQFAAAVGLRAERRHAQLIAAAPTAQGLTFHSPLQAHSVLPPGPPVPPPSPTRVPFSLRI